MPIRSLDGATNQVLRRKAYRQTSRGLVQWMQETLPAEFAAVEIGVPLGLDRRDRIAAAVVKHIRATRPEVWDAAWAKNTAHIPPLPIGRPVGT